jgi:hypothetical protein
MFVETMVNTKHPTQPTPNSQCTLMCLVCERPLLWQCLTTGGLQVMPQRFTSRVHSAQYNMTLFL